MPNELVAKLFHHLESRGDDVAFLLEDDEITFGELDRSSRSYAAHLGELGLEPGERIAAFIETSIDMVIALLGHYRAGGVHVPINTRYGRVEIDHILRDSEARVLVVDDTPHAREVGRRALKETSVEHVIVLGDPPATELSDAETALQSTLEMEPIPRRLVREDEDIALFIYTSGTTGQSKGVELPYRAIVRNIDELTRLWRWSGADNLLLSLPLFHVHGLCIGIHGTLLRGCVATMQRRFSPAQVVEAIGHGATIFMGVPTMYARLLDYLHEKSEAAKSLQSARLFTSGSAALPADHFREFEALTGHRILERYGMSETLLTLSNPYEPGKRKPGTVGFAVPGSIVEIHDSNGERCKAGEVGEIAVRGASLMKGYWNLPEKTAKAFREGWFMSGDVAEYDDDGYVRIVGRRSVDIIKSGGYKISAREIEDTLLAMEDIREIAVVGVPDSEWGERIVAAVVASPGVPPNPDEWLNKTADFLETKLADYKKPTEVVVLDELPRNALGKVQKHRIVDQLAAED